MGKLLGILAGTLVLCGVFLAMVVPTILPDPAACENLDAGAAVPEDADDPGASGSFTTGGFETTSYGPPWNRMNGTGVTATGVDLRPAIPKYGVAVDPSVIPLGSRVYIHPNPHNYSGTFVAFDTGGAIRGRRIDFYDWRGRTAQNQWGRRTAQVSRSPFGTPGGPLIDSGSPTQQATAPSGGSQNLAWPTQDKTISSTFGPRWGRMHAGIDIPVPTGTAIHAAASGTIVLRGWTGGYGNYICIRHPSGLTTCYAHLSTYGPQQLGAQVTAGAVIGRSGNTGNSTGPHLHFEVRQGPSASSPPTNPEPFLTGATAPTGDDMAVDEMSGCGGGEGEPIETVLVGDSLAVGMRSALENELDGWDLVIKAQTGRRLSQARGLLPSADANNRVIALSLGSNNEPSDTAALQDVNTAALAAAGQGGCVVWATIAGGEHGALNDEMRARARADERIKVVDWERHTRDNPDHLARDNVHATPAGYRARARLYANAIRECAPAPQADSAVNGLVEEAAGETDGPRAELRNGRVLAPASAPAAVKRMIAAANAIQHLPYTYGGGHDASFTPSPGFDCSSTVSWVLHRAGLLPGPLVSGAFMKWGRPGKGKWVSIYSHGGHVFITIAGQRLDTSPAGSSVNSARGPRWRGPAARPASGFVVTHPPGL